MEAHGYLFAHILFAAVLIFSLYKIVGTLMAWYFWKTDLALQAEMRGAKFEFSNWLAYAGIAVAWFVSYYITNWR